MDSDCLTEEVGDHDDSWLSELAVEKRVNLGLSIKMLADSYKDGKKKKSQEIAIGILTMLTDEVIGRELAPFEFEGDDVDHEGVELFEIEKWQHCVKRPLQVILTPDAHFQNELAKLPQWLVWLSHEKMAGRVFSQKKFTDQWQNPFCDDFALCAKDNLNSARKIYNSEWFLPMMDEETKGKIMLTLHEQWSPSMSNGLPSVRRAMVTLHELLEVLNVQSLECRSFECSLPGLQKF